MTFIMRELVDLSCICGDATIFTGFSPGLGQIASAFIC